MGLCLATEAACCVASSTVKCCCCLIPCKPHNATRFMYSFGLLITTILAYCMSKWGDQIKGVSLTDSCGPACFNYLAVDRISLGFVLYHSLLCLLTIGVKTSSDPRAIIQNGLWPLKFVLWLGAMIGVFYIPNKYFYNYWIASFIFGFLFIIIQNMILVDFAWFWSGSWVAKMEEEDSVGYKYLLITTTGLFYIAIIVMTALLYAFFARNSGCDLNSFFITFNWLLILFMAIISVMPKVQESNPKSGIFQVAILGLANTYLVGSAIVSQPDDIFRCNSLPGSGSGSGPNSPFATFMLWSGVIFTFLALIYQAFAAGSSLIGVSSADESTTVAEDENDQTAYSYPWFHFIYVLAAMYLTAVITNWGTIRDFQNQETFEVNYGLQAMWVKIVTSWLCSLLYIWTLVAPLLFPDRSFN